MILVIQKRNGHREHYLVTTPAHLMSVASEYPGVIQDIILSPNLADAVRVLVNYLNRHAVAAWVEGEVRKNFLPKVAIAMGLAGATLAPTPGAQEPRPPQAQVEVSKLRVPQFGKQKEDAFLWNIKQIESSGGRNLEHKMVESGLHSGDSAIGSYGMMPKTVVDLATRIKRLGRSTPELDKLSGMAPEHIRQYLQGNPQVELSLARFMARHLLQRHGNDERRAAFSWLHGHNLYPTDISDESLGHDYVKRFEAFDQKNPLRVRTPASVKKNEPADLSFSTRLKEWIKRRDELERYIPPNDTFIPDPGRQRNDAEYEKPTSAQIVRRYAARRKL